MADLVKGVLGGAWSLIVGWILPAFLALQLTAYLVLPRLNEVAVVKNFLAQRAVTQQATILAAAAVAGLIGAAAQAPLYRILEGTSPLWPRKFADARIKHHQTRRTDLVNRQLAAAKTDRGIQAGLLYERAARYPVQEKQFAPTALGNAIRRFETYAGDRYKLDSQLLWHHLTAAAPPPAVTAVEQARANVDFFVALVYGGATTAILGLVAWLASGFSAASTSAIILGLLIASVSYLLAVLATDEWDAAVRALVDHGRNGVAAAFGLTVPADLREERLMWQAINTLVRRPYSYSESRDVADILKRFRMTGNESKPADHGRS
jgi:hypothetical protein